MGIASGHIRREDLKGKKATLIGLGTRTHVALARFLIQNGAEVTISDAKPADKLSLEISLLGDLPVKLGLGGHTEADVLSADIIFVTPGAPRTLPVLKKAQDLGIPFSSEIELLFQLCPAPIVGITGSSGKTTTTTLVGDIFKLAGRRTFVGGNLGIPLIDQIDAIGSDAWVVLELSSFQLEYMRQSPHIGAVLNITPNHLDRHGTMENYAAAKSNIVLHQDVGDWAVLGADDRCAHTLASRCPGKVALFSARREVETGAFARGDEVILRLGGKEHLVCRRSDILLRGDHNFLNVLAASAIAAIADIDIEAIRHAVQSFRGVEHRQEMVREINGATYYNDSIATSPERTLAAINAFDPPIVLLAGGKSKHLAVEALAEAIVKKARHVILMGEFGQELEQAIRNIPTGASLPIDLCDSLESAVAKASEVARPGDSIVLSPGGTSFDWFRDFEDRGQRFKALVNDLRA